MSHIKEAGLFILISILGCTSLIGQSDNYWSWNSNTHSTLLAGAVVGGQSGPSSIFYNPALINHENQPSLALSANLFSFQFYQVENIAGDNLDADKFLFRVQPRFISYVFPTENERLGLQMALLSPTSESIEYSAQYEAELDIIARTDGAEQYNGYMRYSREYDDTWGGFGFSYQLSDQLYVGGSLFLSYKSMDLYALKSSEAYQLGDSVLVGGDTQPRYIASSGYTEEMSYWYLSVIPKVGVQYSFGERGLSLGLNLTMPDIPIYGSADVRKLFYRNSVHDDNSDEFVSNEHTLASIESGDVRVKNPFSLAFGGAYEFRKSNVLLFTVEYFSQVKAYEVIESDIQATWLPELISNNLNNNQFMSYGFKGRPVTNAAIGYKNVISESLAFLGGFRTDFTVGSKDELRYVDNKFGVNQLHMNKWHITTGLLFEVSRYKVLAGFQYTYARSNDLLQAANFTNPVEYNSATDQSLDGPRRRVASAALNELTLFFGFSITGKK